MQVPSFGDWGFNLASKKELNKKLVINVDTKYLSEENIDSLFIFGKDEIPEKDVEINSLSKPSLLHYYLESVKNWD